jgi:multidrug resistance efflux pump
MTEPFKDPIARLVHALVDIGSLPGEDEFGFVGNVMIPRDEVMKCVDRARDATNDVAAELATAKARVAELESLLVRLRGVCLHWEAVANDLDGKKFTGVRDMLRRCAKGLREELGSSAQADVAKTEPDYAVADEDASPFAVDADQDELEGDENA